MIFTRPYLLAVLAPLLLFLFFRRRKGKNFVGHPLLFYLRGKIRPASRLVLLPRLLEWLSLGFLIVAVLDPVLPRARYLVTREGLDIVLVLDLSSSMQEPIDPAAARQRWRLGITGYEKSRLEAVKEAMIQFVRKRQGDRIGLVVFSEHGYVVAPMTADVSYLVRYLQMVDRTTLSGEGQTAIGEGILTALSLAAQQSDGNRRKGKVMVVLTDGENNTGRDVYMALQKATDSGFKIHYIGVALENSQESSRLVAAVRTSGGNYYDVRDRAQIEQAHADISRLEKGTFYTHGEQTHVPRFYPFALTSLLLLVSSLGLKAAPYFTEIS